VSTYKNVGREAHNFVPFGWNDHEGEVPPHTIPFFLLLSSCSTIRPWTD
jgi:hypothetical protein